MLPIVETGASSADATLAISLRQNRPGRLRHGGGDPGRPWNTAWPISRRRPFAMMVSVRGAAASIGEQSGPTGESAMTDRAIPPGLASGQSTGGIG